MKYSFHWLGNALRGFCMGLADVIPGVSGGTIAFILGIYPRLIDAIGSLSWTMIRRLRHRSFWRVIRDCFHNPYGRQRQGAHADARRILLLVSVALGVIPAIEIGAYVLLPLLSSHPSPMRGLFLGLVAASVVMPFREIKRRSVSRWVVAGAAACAAVWVVGMSASMRGHAVGTVTIELDAPDSTDILITPGNLTLAVVGDERSNMTYRVTNTTTVPAGATSAVVQIVASRAGRAGNVAPGSLRVEESGVEIRAVTQTAAVTGGRDPHPLYVFLGGVLAVSAMSLPGLSGAAILLLLGLYEFVLQSLWLVVRSWEATLVVGAMVAGMGVGILTFGRLLKYLFSKWSDLTLAVLAGLMVGSLRVLWPFVELSATGSEVPILPTGTTSSVPAVATMFVAGVSAVLLLDRVGRRHGQP